MEVAAAAKGRDLHQLGRAVELWHSKQVQNSLGQVPSKDPATRRALLAHAAYIREGLACALEGVDDAIREVCEACDLPLPDCLELRPPEELITEPWSRPAPAGEKRR